MKTKMPKNSKFFGAVIAALVGGVLSVSADEPSLVTLPSGYTAVDWIESSGTQWVNLNIVPNCTDRVEMEVLFPVGKANSTAWHTLFCARDTSSKNTFTVFWGGTENSGKFRVDRNATTGGASGPASADGVRYAFTFDYGARSASATADGVAASAPAFPNDTASFTPGSSLALFATHSAGSGLGPNSAVTNHARYRLYAFRLLDSQGALRANLVPCVNDSGEAGLYDTVRNLFIANSGRGVFATSEAPRYAKRVNGAYVYYNAAMTEVPAPEGGLSDAISLAFANTAEFQSIAALPASERALAKDVALVGDVVLSADTDWSALDFDMNDAIVTLKGCRLKVASLLGKGAVTSSGQVIANGNFSADPIPAGSTRTASLLPKGWKGSSNVIVKNDDTYCGHQKNGAIWFCVSNGGSVSQTFTAAMAGTYRLSYNTVAKNPSSGSTSYATSVAKIDGVTVRTDADMGWIGTNGRGVSIDVTVNAGTHTFALCCTKKNVIFKNVSFYPTANYVNKTSVLEVCVPEGAATTNAAVTIAGGASMRVEKTGLGSLTMGKVNDGFGAANAIAGWESVIVKEGTLYKTGNGATIGTQYARVKVEDGGQVDIGGRSYWDYDYDLCGAGPDGSGALVNTTSVTQPWAASKTGYLRHLMLSGDATVGGTQSWGMIFHDYSANTATMNGHTLTYAGALIYGGLLSYSGTGGLVIDEGATVEFCTKTPTAGDVDLEVCGTLQQHDYALSPVKSLRFTATGTFNNPYATRPTFVVRTDYAPNTNVTASSTAKHPTVQLGAAGYLETTLDLSSFTNAFDGASTTFFAGSFVTVDLGARELAVGEKIVSWSTAPAEGVQFLLAGDNVAPYQLGREADGLYIKGVPTFATINPSTGEWSFFGANGDPYPGVWEAGVTDEIEVRFSSLAEFEAIKAAAVTPSRYVLTSLALTEPTDMTGGFPFLTAHHLTIDLKGQTLKLPAETVRDSFDLTIIDTTGGYDYLDAITSSGTQYIDTGFTCSQETRIDASFNTLTRTQNYAMFFGVTSNDSKDDGIGLRYMSDADQTLSAWFCAGANISAATGMWNKDVTATLAKSTLIINGVSYPFTTTKTPYQKPLYLFCGNNGGSAWRHQAMKLYSFKMTEAGVVVRDFVPVRRHRDNAVGLLDRVNNVFYANKGSGAFTAGTVTEVVAAGELVLDVAAEQTVSLDAESATVMGEVKLVKVGAGTLVTGKAQTYVGGTEVRAGTLKYGVYPGAAGSPVTVYEGGVFDLAGKSKDMQTGFVLAGGELVNTTANVGNDISQNYAISVAANSSATATCSFGLIGRSYVATTLDLGGKELSVEVASGKSFWLYNTAVTAGTLKLSGAGTLAIDKTSVRAAEADFDLGCDKVTVAVPTEVHDWIVRGNVAVSGGGTVTINGTYRPIGDAVSTYALKDGATLDLSARNTQLDLAGKNVTFADGATITVKAPQCAGLVVRWTKPANLDTLAFVKAPGDAGVLTVTDEGIYIRYGMAIIVR